MSLLPGQPACKDAPRSLTLTAAIVRTPHLPPNNSAAVRKTANS
jgi:hypothetical protein